MSEAKITEVRFHGRGGQGVVTAGRLLAEAALLEGKYIGAFPEFGPERSGAPIRAFTRISEEKFTIKSAVYTPDVVCVIDPTLISIIPKMITEGLVEGGQLIINSEKSPEELKNELGVQQTLGSVDATTIALDTLGRPIANTAILGALVKITGIVKLESLITAIKNLFPGPLGEKNVDAIKRSYEEVKWS